MYDRREAVAEVARRVATSAVAEELTRDVGVITGVRRFRFRSVDDVIVVGSDVVVCHG